MPRLFVALGLPEPLREAVRELQSGLRNARWLQEDGLHLTLAFIGEVDNSTKQQIEVALGTVQAPPLPMALHGLGCFPRQGAPQVLWTGALPKAELASLAEAVRRTLPSAGVTPERRNFLPHVTIARFRQPPPNAELKRYLGTFEQFRSCRAEVSSFHLFSSRLRQSGAQYRIETTYPLAAAPS